MNKINNNPITQWFITFPQCMEEKKATFYQKFPPSSYSKCCEELHEDGGRHLHLILQLKKGLSKPKLSKFIEQKFPESYKRIHYKPIKSLNHAIDYVGKEDPTPVEIGTKTKSNSLVCKLTKSGRVLLELGICTPLLHLTELVSGDPKDCKKCNDYGCICESSETYGGICHRCEKFNELLDIYKKSLSH